MDLPTVAYISSLEQFFITGGSPTTEAIMGGGGGGGNGKWNSLQHAIILNQWHFGQCQTIQRS